jgi:uncharacterized protein (DUF1778 family)
MKTTSETKSKVNRIDLRVSSSQKALLEKAAAIKGLSLSAYLLSHGLEAAQADITAYQKLVLSDRDRDLFLALLENPPQPNQKLTQAMQKFQQQYEVDS